MPMYLYETQTDEPFTEPLSGEVMIPGEQIWIEYYLPDLIADGSVRVVAVDRVA
jgi:hypothetical protein